ncbi:prostaglandin D2 receptor 2 isoform X2 [Notolabrus celidotus]|uniref:prostaglandin D2 receptor 2 isoform X2 n=1 Tax=Notolabrus celidotus TaxID=1203425 RepID=UPI00149076CC|nr:prostaglandin D2 receptor 2 isoform X2 [Notolabrus celidotus]XP_034544324.1 prostaglandin D2 receptor 2 isoform X2 [Notolabrus celidotus]XP_034544325.1 prostaglandin D2 receptor 2 isoform X2 [Notolabrus celidotus]
MSNVTLIPDVSGGQLYCPMLQAMKEHSLNNNTKANMVVVCIHGLVSCLGILENALILWVVGFRLRRRTVASVWVLNLAMSDFLATLTLPLFTFYLSSSHSWDLGGPLCKTQASIFFLNMFVSAFLLAAISLDRCLLVAKPVWSQNYRSVAGAWKVCALGWLWAAFNTFPYLLFRSVTEKQDGRKLCYHNFALYASSVATLERDCKVRQVATAISKLLIAFLFPLVVIAGSYIQICLSLRKRRRKRKQSASRLTDALILSNRNEASTTTTKTNMFLKPPSSGPSLAPTPTTLSPSTNPSQMSQSFTKMVTFVIAAFVLCWAPYHIFCMIEVSAQYLQNNLYLVEVGLPLATTFAFLNPVLNPILYAFSCPNFCVRIRQSLGAVFDGLVEEGGGLLMVPGRSIRAHIRRKSSRDVGFGTPGSPRGSCSPRPTDFRPSFPPPASPVVGRKDRNEGEHG